MAWISGKLNVGLRKMETVEFLVQGSAPEPYRVVFLHGEEKLAAHCSCPAGIKGQYCKHRLNILDGNEKNIVSENIGDVTIVRSWLKGSNLEGALLNYRELDREAHRIKARLSQAKKTLAKAMR